MDAPVLCKIVRNRDTKLEKKVISVYWFPHCFKLKVIGNFITNYWQKYTFGKRLKEHVALDRSSWSLKAFCDRLL